MTDSKRYDGSQWEHSLRKLTTATEAVENPLYSDGTTITAYTLKGNTVQNGTPTPSNPVDVQGVGVRTENLLDMSTVYVGYHLDITTGLPIGYGNSRMATLTPIDVSQFSAVTIAYTSVGDTIQFMYSIFDSADALIDRVAGKVSGDSINVSSAAKLYIAFYRNTALTINSVEDVILNEGTTPRSYEPHGYKIPISSASTTTSVYLGEVSSTRQIKKYVITGNETISYYDYDYQCFLLTIPTIPSMGTRLTPIICTHYIGIYDGRPIAQVPMYAVYTGSATDNSVLIKTDQTTDRSTFIAWLQEQYANGTPVTLWYAISTPETASVNEPLMKIGTYADTLSNATAIPTTEGANSITVDTTVQPSEFTATWTGWHDASVKEKSENLWNESYTGIMQDLITYLPLNVGNGDYTLSSTATREGEAAVLFLLAGNVSTGATTVNNGVWNDQSRTVAAVDGYITIGYRKYLTANPENANTMLNTGETALPYEPYWK